MDPVGLAALICGIAPLPLALTSLVPFAGLCAGALLLASVPAAITLGIVGIVRARRSAQGSVVLPLAGLTLGLAWLMLGAAAVLFIQRRGAP